MILTFHVNFQLTSKMKQNPIQNTTSATLLKLSFRFPFKSRNRDFSFDFLRFCLWNIIDPPPYILPNDATLW